MTQDECKELAEWFFRQKVVKFGIDYIQLSDGTKVTFMPDADGNLVDALEEKMCEQSGIDHISIGFAKDAVETRVRITYYKFITNIGTSYAIGGMGRNQRDARIKVILKYIRNGTMI